jgi:hypothetical protein
MNEREDIQTSPVTGWTVAPVSAMHAVMLRLDYLTHATQPLDQAHHSPQYILNAAQARQLAEALQRQAALSEIGGPQGTGLPKH